MPLNVSVEISQFGETLIKDSRTQSTYTHTKPHEPSWIYFSLLKKYHIRTYFKRMKIRSAAVPVSVWFKEKKTDSWRQVKSFKFGNLDRHVRMDANVMRRFRWGKWQRAPLCSTHDFVILSLYINTCGLPPSPTHTHTHTHAYKHRLDLRDGSVHGISTNSPRRRAMPKLTHTHTQRKRLYIGVNSRRGYNLPLQLLPPLSFAPPVLRFLVFRIIPLSPLSNHFPLTHTLSPKVIGHQVMTLPIQVHGRLL